MQVVNVYDTPDSQIKWHDDGEYSVGPVVASYSLGRTATMGFRRKPSKKKKSKWGKPLQTATASRKSKYDEESYQAKLARLRNAPQDVEPVFKGVANVAEIDAKPDASGITSIEVRRRRERRKRRERMFFFFLVVNGFPTAPNMHMSVAVHRILISAPGSAGDFLRVSGSLSLLDYALSLPTLRRTTLFTAHLRQTTLFNAHR